MARSSAGSWVGTNPKRIGRYLIESTLGSGGMGVVYRARDPELDRAVAVKVLRSGLDAARLKHEAQALAKIAHRNVVAVHDVGTQDEMYIVMELVDGDTLRIWLQTETRERSEIVRVLVEAARGVVAAHEVGLVHRDLKPDNVFVSRKGKVLVGDFGLVSETSGSRESEDDAGELTRSRLAGTPAYMAPEQADGDATTASDQFSFCVMAWEALVGRRPFDGATLAELHANARAGSIVEPPSERALPRPLAVALRRGLSADPARRFSSMQALLDVLAPRTRARIAVAGVAVLASGALAATLLVLGRHQEAAGAALIACGDEPAKIATVWNPARRAALDRALAGNDELGARIDSLFDATASQWVVTRRLACVEQRATGPSLFQQRTTCFDRVQRDLDAATNALLAKKSVTAEDVALLESAFPVSRCRTRAALVTPPTAGQQARVAQIRAAVIENQLATITTDGLRGLQSQMEVAKATGYDGVTDEVAAAIAASAYRLDLYPAAEISARQAIEVAERSGDDVVRAVSAATLAKTLARGTNFVAADEQLAVAHAAAERTGNDPYVGVAIQSARAEVARLRNGDQRVELQESLVEQVRSLYGAHSFNLALALIDLADTYPSRDRAKAQKALDAALSIMRADSGVTTEIAWAVGNVDRAAGDLARLIVAQRQLVALSERYLGHGIEVTEAISAYQDLASYLELGLHWTEAIGAYNRALDLFRSLAHGDAQTHFDLLLGLGIVQREHGDGAVSIATLEEARHLETSTFPAPVDRITLDATLGEAHESADHHQDAIRLLDPLVEPLRVAKPARHKALGLVCASLARALWANGGARDRARELAGDAVTALGQALDEFASDPTRGPQSDLVKHYRDDIQSWLQTHAK